MTPPQLLQTGDGRLIVPRCHLADGFWTRLRGLLGRSGLEPDEGLWIEPCSSVHMFFMRFALDVAFVDRLGVVQRVYPNLRPWRATWIVPRARAAVELPVGTLATHGVEPGTILLVVPPLSPLVG